MGSGVKCSPEEEFADNIMMSIHSRLMVGILLPTNLKVMEMAGCIQMLLRPSPIDGSSFHVK